MTKWKITQINTEHMNEFQHRQVVFTRIKSVGDGFIVPYSRAIQIWDVDTDQLMLTIEPAFEQDITNTEIPSRSTLTYEEVAAEAQRLARIVEENQVAKAAYHKEANDQS